MEKKLEMLQNHIVPTQTMNAGKVTEKSPDDIVIIGFARSAVTKRYKGALRDTPFELILSPILDAAIEMACIKKEQVGDIQIGNTLVAGSGAGVSRIG